VCPLTRTLFTRPVRTPQGVCYDEPALRELIVPPATGFYDAATGGCRDGLHVDRVNENQGAESTLAYLAAVIDARLLAAELPRERRARTGARA